MTVSEIFETQNPNLISLFFDKFDERQTEEDQGFISPEEAD